jgi:hypothetical protein
MPEYDARKAKIVEQALAYEGYIKRMYRYTFLSWYWMHVRCYRPSNQSYKYYGARGITVCERWSDFETFLRDMGPRPSGLTLGRIDNDGNYEPANCRWETDVEQAANKRPPYSVTPRPPAPSVDRHRGHNVPKNLEELKEHLERSLAMELARREDKQS